MLSQNRMNCNCQSSLIITVYLLSLVQYYQDMLLMQELLPAVPSIAGDMFVFQQDNAPVHCAHDTVELLHSETP